MTRKFTLLILFLAGTTLTLMAQVQRKVFIEEFTQASCPPCSFHNPPFDALMELNKDKVVLVKHETWWPGFGPFYEQNPDENRTWIQYNGITGAPNVLIGGTTLPTGQYFVGAPLNVTQAMVDQMAQQTTPLMIVIDHEVSETLDSLTVHVSVINVTDQPVTNRDMRLRMALMENDLRFASPPGTNGETHFIHTTRKFIPGTAGISLGDVIQPNDTLSYTEKIYLPNYLYRYADLAVAAWVQVQSGRAVLQSEISWPKAITAPVGDVATVPNVDAGNGLCDLNISGNVEVTNEGGGDVTSMSLAYLINGAIQGTSDWTGTLAPGETTTVDLPSGMVEPGRSNIAVAVLRVNGARDTSTFNNQFSNTIYKMDGDIYSATLAEGFEGLGLGENPESAININPNGYRTFIVDRSVNSQLITWPLGAFENSESCYRFDFPVTPRGGEAALVFRKIDMSEYENSYLSMNYAYTNQTVQNDRLRVLISSDCGANWTELFNKAGAEMRTANPVSGTRFYPRRANWVADTMDISAFDGSAEVIVAFIGTSDEGNCLYLDDITIGEKTTTSTRDAGILEGNVSIFPNPASGPVQIIVDLDESVTGTIQIHDLTGRFVHTVTSAQSLAAGRHQFEWTPQVSSGVYLMKVVTDKGQWTERITIAQ